MMVIARCTAAIAAAGALLFPAAACSSGQAEQASSQPQSPRVVDSGPYAIENAALDRAVDLTGLPRESTLWIQRTWDGRVVCGALAHPSGTPVMFLSGPEGTGYVGAPLARLTPEVGEQHLDQWNNAVLVNCADHNLIPPERVTALLR